MMFWLSKIGPCNALFRLGRESGMLFCLGKIKNVKCCFALVKLRAVKCCFGKARYRRLMLRFS